jgi:uncharacterized cupin superfamily protein
MSIATAIEFANSGMALSSAPINPDWILDGAPVARAQQIYRSRDGAADTFIWECTPGRFNWFYGVDETAFIIEGSVVVRDEAGIYNHLQAGSTIFFPAGSRAEWLVDQYVRKIAFCRVPLTRKLIAARYIYRRLKGLIGQGSGEHEGAPIVLGHGTAPTS